MRFDIVSDLHVESWEHSPYDWEGNKQCANVIIAGDIADTLDLTVRELRVACDHYDRVLYVTGNHEGTYNYHDLKSVPESISFAMKDRPNFFNLETDGDLVIESENLVVIGRNGWWDFRICEPEVSYEESTSVFSCEWCPDPSLHKNLVIENIVEAARSDYEAIKAKLRRYESYNICMVTHTVPHRDLLSQNYPLDRKFAGYYGNSRFGEFFEADSVKYVIFGHNHDSVKRTRLLGKLCINNARGRPGDYNRSEYTPLVLNTNE